MKILGIIGGMSPESTATYYTEINRLVNQKKGGNISAPIVMVSVEFEEIVQCQKQSEWQRAGEILAEAGKKIRDDWCRRYCACNQYHAQSGTSN